MPGWVKTGYDGYAKRLPRECELLLKEIPPGQRSKNCGVARIIKNEGERMNAAIPVGTRIVALELSGKSWVTAAGLSLAMKRWLESGKNTALNLDYSIL
jgi:23S rRNA (pseudouridine1915-N3)-methyltransferase